MAPASSPRAARAIARMARISMRLPARSWLDRGPVQAVEQRTRRGRVALGQQQPGQDEMTGLVRVIRRVTGVEPAVAAHRAAPATSPWASSSRAR